MNRRRIKGFITYFVGMLLLFSVLHAEVFPINDLLITGSTDRRINIVFLSEGYRDVEMGQFELDVQQVLDGLFSESPYSEYQNFFNVYAVEVPSQQSGTDHPGTADDCPIDMPTFHNNTYFNSTFDYSGIHRALVAKNSQAIYETLQDNMPEWDVAFIVVNTEYYGGTGGAFATISMDSASAEIALHELGHSFAGLADEYDYGGMMPYEGPNVTAETDREFIKWNGWIEETTPIPTPEMSTYSEVIGLFEGAVYQAIGWYRPKLDCKMKILGVPFCEVCTEQTVNSVYNILQTPVDGYEPALDSVTVASDEVLQFVVRTVKTVPNTIQAVWTVDDGVATEGIDTLLFDASSFEPGEYMVTVSITDTTLLVRNAAPGQFTTEIEWVVTIEENVTGSDLPRPHAVVLRQNYPNPFNPVTTISYYLPAGGEVLLQVFDVNGREIRRLVDGYVEAGEWSVVWDGSNERGDAVTSGVYFVRLRSGAESAVRKTILLQ
jgi:hypothetical protein